MPYACPRCRLLFLIAIAACSGSDRPAGPREELADERALLRLADRDASALPQEVRYLQRGTQDRGRSEPPIDSATYCGG